MSDNRGVRVTYSPGCCLAQLHGYSGVRPAPGQKTKLILPEQPLEELTRGELAYLITYNGLSYEEISSQEDREIAASLKLQLIQRFVGNLTDKQFTTVALTGRR